MNVLRGHEEGKGQKGAGEGVTWRLRSPRLLPRRLLKESLACVETGRRGALGSDC